MAKTVTFDNKFFAFWGMVIAAAVMLFGGIFSALGTAFVLIASIFNLVGKIAILIAIAFPAWNHICRRNVAWKIIYFVALIIYILGAVLDMVFA